MNWRAQSMKLIPPETKPTQEEIIPMIIKERIQIPDIGSPQKSPSKRMKGDWQGYFEGTLIRSNVQGPIIATSNMISIAVRQIRLFFSSHNIFCFPQLSTSLFSLYNGFFWPQTFDFFSNSSPVKYLVTDRRKPVQ